MPRPTNKVTLLSEIDKEYSALQAYLATLSPAQMQQASIVGAWSVKDVLAHLMVWEQMCLAWFETGKRGETPVTPAEGYTWREIPRLNEQIYQDHRQDSLDVLQAQFASVHEAMLAALQPMSEEELFQVRYYRWTNTTTLGSYFTSATCSHFAWARKEIRAGFKKQA